VISYISGVLKHNTGEYIIVDNGGIGYRIAVSPKTASLLPQAGSEVCIHTYMSVSESDIALYGFYSAEELDLFNSLIGVSGIGPKGALAMLGAISPSQLVMAVLTDDIKTLSSAPGIGKKTAQRLVLELKDKLNQAQALADDVELAAVPATDSGEKVEAVEALEALGFTRVEATKAVNAVYVDGMTSEKAVSKALRVLGG
jgi:Holliday junction DNA helicase RuvA